MEKIQLNVTGDQKELIIRTGEALPEERPNPVTLTGNIFSPALFVAKRKQDFEKQNAHVLVSKKHLSIILKTGEQFGRGFTVKGQLVKNPHLNDLKINTDGTFDKKALQKILKFRRTLFIDRDNYANIMNSLENFTVKSQTEVQDHDNRRGNVNQQFKRESQLDVPLNFTLALPVYEGTDKVSFQVEVLVDVRDGGASFYLESIELADLLERVRDEVFDTELEQLTDYVIITE